MPALARFARRYLLADAAPLSAQERWRSTLAALLGMLLIQAVLAVLPGPPGTRQLLAPLGASSVILFALPHSPLGQPWSTAGGLLLSALIGLGCGLWIGPAWLAIPVALALAIWVMALLRCIHPPGGAMAVLFAGGAVGFRDTGLATACFNVLAVLVAALAVNALIPGRRWPQGVADGPPERNREQRRTGIRHEDLQHALARVDGFLDINEDDLTRVYDLALAHAWARHERRTCADLMGAVPPCVEFGTPLHEAWELLRRHRLTALPVVDPFQRVIGLIGPGDFLRHVEAGPQHALAAGIRQFLRPTPGTHASKPEVVGQVMGAAPLTARAEDNIGAVAARLVQAGGLAPVPVLGIDGRLVGLLEPADLLAALYHRRALGRAAASGSGAVTA